MSFNLNRIIIKVGTNLITREDGSLNTDFITRIASGVKRLQMNNKEVILVTSGAVAAGRSDLHFARYDDETLHERQALAAVGQGSLMQKYYRVFTLEYKIIVAQILLQSHDFENLDTLQNTHNTLKLLLSKKVLPIVNENDVTATDELKYMANDHLAARVANLVGADGLILLTDVEGLFEEDPHENPKTKIIKTAEKSNLKKLDVGDANRNGHGGMKTKLKAAEIAECPIWIADGNIKNILSKIVLKDENPGTFIV